MTRAVFEVWGDPIAHSRSPAMHAAAYAFLGLDWTYGRRRVPAGEFGATFAALGDTHRGLSVTFPLKQEAAAACDTLDASALRTGAVNTVLRGAAGIRGWNTDVGGIVDALAEHGITAVSRGRVVGAGATATSALVALCTLGADHVEIIARRPGPPTHCSRSPPPSASTRQCAG